MQAGDILTLDYSDKYLLLNIIKSNNKNYYLAVGVNNDESDLDLDQIIFFEEILENNEVYVSEIVSPKMIDMLSQAALIQNNKRFDEYRKLLNEYYEENK